MGWSSSSSVLVDNLTIEKNASDQLQIKGGAVTSSLIQDGTIVNDDISATASIAKTKLAALNIADSDIITGASITQSKINLSITNNEISASAGIAFTKLAALSSGNILVGNSSNQAASVAMSGDATISNAGALSIAKGIRFLATGTWSNSSAGYTFSGLSGQKTYKVYYFLSEVASGTGSAYMQINGNTGNNYSFISMVSNAVQSSNGGQFILGTAGGTGSDNDHAGEITIFARHSTLQNQGAFILCNNVGDVIDSSSPYMVRGTYNVDEELTSIKIYSSNNTTGAAYLFEVVPA